MQAQYKCPVCGAQVAFGINFCGNCRTQLNWPTQPQYQPPPQYQQQYQQSGQAAQYQQAEPPKKKTNLWLLGFLAFIVIVVLIAAAIFTYDRLRRAPPPPIPAALSTPPAQPPTPPPILPSPPSSNGVQIMSPANGSMGIPVNSASFSWAPYKETTKYKFDLAKDAAMTQIVKEAETSTDTYLYEGTIDYSTNYFWRVMSEEPAPSDWSAIFSFQTEAPPT
jgi:hypothetical protein